MLVHVAQVAPKVSNEIGLTNKKSIETVDNIIEIIKSTLESGEDVLFSGFGEFSILEKNVRKGRNPATGNDMMLPARKVVNFKCSGNLRERISRKD
ncbi:MAG: integration host factor subunit alpha [Desulfobacteraceae bacterium]|nr:integration host factor subunit alpha [Desulfobacteraceae bacterium]MBC2755447.1 integration host factor subunit alpha [Desulfobacteraceae bacterium]